ncbi:zelda [Carabus blaptoides fortunei]
MACEFGFAKRTGPAWTTNFVRTASQSFNSHPNNTIAAAADSSDAMLKTSSASNKSPDSFTSRTTPETSTSFGHPPTPQSYNSVPSPYQSAEASTFSPGYQNYPPYFSMDQQHAHQQQQQLGYPQDYPVHKIPTQSAGFRYHPYHHPSPYERSPHVTSSSPAYPSQNPQPTPSPSPKQCDKCGFVCDSATQLIDHLNHAHPPTPAPHMNHTFQQNQQQQHFQFNNLDKPDIKTEDEPQTEILDLDSHKVHQVFQSPEEEESMKRHNGELSTLGGHNPHSVTAMLNPWSNTSPQQKLYSPTGSDHRMFLAGAEQKIFPNAPQDNKVYAGAMPEAKMFQQEQKLFQPHQIHSPDFMTNGVTTTTQDGNPQGIGVSSMGSPAQMGPGYRPFDHISSQPNPPVISSTQLPNSVPNNNPPAAQGKGANWKSNEARRPKTYNCSACNKWFTSSGHLKRHYNTTLHKNAVKSSGQPDPASLPISAHHHPGRDSVANRANDSSNHSPDPHDDSRVDEASAYERTQMPGLLQQPPSGPYDRQPPPNLGGPQPPSLHSPMTQNSSSLSNSLTNLSAGSPPNGEAGPSATHQDHSRGLLSISTPNTPQQVTPLSPMAAASLSTGTSQQSPVAFTLLSQPPPPHLMGIQHSPEDNNINTTNHHTHHPHQQVVFQNMSPPSSMPTSYPNGLAPHVTPVTAISNLQPGSTSLTITGEPATAAAAAMYSADLLQPYGQPQQYFSTNSLAADQQPLPSFAQFQPHRYGLLLTAAGYQHQANVGGLSPQVAFSPAGSPYLTDSQHSFSPAPGVDSQSLMFQDTDGDYEITVLENSETVLPDETSQTLSDDQPPLKVIKLSPASPIRDELKRDYENGSPRITSTGSPLAGKTAPPGVHKCFDCDKIFNKACYLTQHNKTFHCGDKPFKCGRCGKRFPSDDSYQEHLAKHAGDKPYKCELCPKQFNHKTDLRRHMCLHTGQKPYACDHCGKGFIRKDHMLKHADTHARKTANNKQHAAAS